MAIGVVIAEDDLLVREGILRILEPSDEVELLAACGDRDDLLRAIERHSAGRGRHRHPDAAHAHRRGPRDRRHAAHRAPRHGVVVLLSQYAEAAYALTLLAEGTARRGYLLKERVADGDELAARSAGWRRAGR